MRQGNIDTVNHAESTLARQAYKDYTIEQLQKCTLYSTFEPCAVRDINIFRASNLHSLKYCVLAASRCAQPPCTGLV